MVSTANTNNFAQPADTVMRNYMGSAKTGGDPNSELGNMPMDRGSLVASANGVGDTQYPNWGLKSQQNSYQNTSAKKGSMPMTS